MRKREIKCVRDSGAVTSIGKVGTDFRRFFRVFADVCWDPAGAEFRAMRFDESASVRVAQPAAAAANGPVTSRARLLEPDSEDVVVDDHLGVTTAAGT